MADGFKYRAFISYSHKDGAWGDWLHKALEGYRVPKHLVGTPGRDGPIAEKLFPIFRDRDELPSSSDLNDQIKVALEQSAYLIVICSPAGARSRWVNEEILDFKRLGRADQIFALIVEGEPNASDKAEIDPSLECFPAALKFKLGLDGQLTSERTEPIAADARPQGDGKENAKLKLIAGLLGINFDALKRRELEAARRRARIYQSIAASMALLAVLALLASWFAFQQRQEAQYQRDQTLQAQMRLLTQSASDHLKNGDVPGAQGIILEVLGNRKAKPSDRATAVSVFQEMRAADAQIAALSGHTDWVESARYSPDSRRIVTASDDKTARIWDAATGAELTRLSGHGDSVNSAAYSPNGMRIVTASGDKTARIWDAATGAELIVLSGHGDGVISAAYSPDGRHIVTASTDKTARIWDAATGEQLGVLSGHSNEVISAAYSPDGKRVVTGSRDKTARIWDAATGAQLAVLSGHGDRVNSVAYSPDGRRIVTASWDKTARIWDANTAVPLIVLSGHTNVVYSATWSSDGQRVVTASHDKTARIWDASTGVQLAVLSGHGDPVGFAAYSPDGQRIVTASVDKTARIWYADKRQQLATLSGHGNEVISAAYSPDSKRIVTASYDKTARIWDATTGIQLELLAGHSDGVNSGAYSPDGRRIVTASVDKTARIWDAATGAQLAVLSGHTAQVNSATYSPDGRHIVTASTDKTARIWDAATGAQLIVLSGHGDGVISAAYSPDGMRIVTASSDKTARTWIAHTGAQLAVLSGHNDQIISAAYSPDGRRIVTASFDKTARIWDAFTGAQLVVLSGHGAALNSARYSPNGRRIVTASSDKTARIWDAATGAQLSVLPGYRVFASAAYSPDGGRIVTASVDNTARVWDAKVPADLDSQIIWDQAAEFDPLPEIERTELGLPTDARIRRWQDDASKCDSAAAAPYDPDRLAPGVQQEDIAADVARSACAGEIAKSGNTPRLAYQSGRTLLAKHDIAGARREFERAVSNGYRAARIDLANLLGGASPGVLDPNRAVSLYEQAWRDGVPIAAFELGHLYESGVSGPSSAAGASLHPNPLKAWFWYQKGADAGEPNALARFAERDERSAVTENAPPKKDAMLLKAFSYYAASAERAQDEDWPDTTWRNWRYHRATLARLLAHDGMMQQVADAYSGVINSWSPPPPKLLQRITGWLHM